MITARIVAGHGRHYYAQTEDGSLFEARRRGKKGDVVVGDVVNCSPADEKTLAVESITPRRNLLFRSDEWRIKELASNVDLVAVVFAPRPTYNPWFVWRAVVAAKTAGIDVMAIRNKADLADGKDAADRFAEELSQRDGCPTIMLSAHDTEATVARLAPLFSGKTVLLIGQSGMGKSTILNALIPDAQAKTREFSEALDLGKQTTTATRLYRTEIGGIDSAVIDSPGFQEFGLAHVTRNDILRAMPDILDHAQGCRFYNCTHLHEPGCSVRAAVDAGAISLERYDFFTGVTKDAQDDVC